MLNKILCFFIGHDITATWFVSFDALVQDPHAAPDIEFVFCRRCYGQDPTAERPIFRTLPDVLFDTLESIARRQDWRK